MIRNFGNKVVADLFRSGYAKKIPQSLCERAIDLLDIMEAVDTLDDLLVKGFPPNLRLHKLKGNRRNEYAIDINKTAGWRITFKLDGNEFTEVKVENYH